ncbi:UNVERIFIED_CONTAM: hypothetical protein Cloal_3457 [Acetivibrio alkalicellulosi]
MKKTAFLTLLVSGILCIIMYGILFFSDISIANSYNKALSSGNILFAAQDYIGALEAYKEGLIKRPNDDKLNYNSALCAYNLGDYYKALELYNNTSEQLEKYLKSGNSYFRLGELSMDPNEKMKVLGQALEFYKNGIIKFPENVDIKYNYEFVKRLLEDLDDSSNENQEDDDQSQDQESEENESQKDDQEDSQNEQENSDNNTDDSEDSEENPQSPEEESNEDSESSDNNDEDQQDNLSDISDTEIDDDLAQALRILEMLEKLEEESLKNNQGVIIDGKESEYDW